MTATAPVKAGRSLKVVCWNGVTEIGVVRLTTDAGTSREKRAHYSVWSDGWDADGRRVYVFNEQAAGTPNYAATVDSCTCKAGEFGKACKHRDAVRAMTARELI